MDQALRMMQLDDAGRRLRRGDHFRLALLQQRINAEGGVR